MFVLATASRMDLADHLRKASLADLYEVRMMIETRAARLAAERRTAADAAALEAALERRTRAARRSDEEFIDADVALHTAVVAAAGNPVLTALFEQFVPTLREALTDLVRRTGRATRTWGTPRTRPWSPRSARATRTGPRPWSPRRSPRPPCAGSRERSALEPATRRLRAGYGQARPGQASGRP